MVAARKALELDRHACPAEVELGIDGAPKLDPRVSCAVEEQHTSRDGATFLASQRSACFGWQPPTKPNTCGQLPWIRALLSLLSILGSVLTSHRSALTLRTHRSAVCEGCLERHGCTLGKTHDCDLLWGQAVVSKHGIDGGMHL